jgi:hypothetical protein
MGTKQNPREEREIERVKIEIHVKHIITQKCVNARTYIHTNTIVNSKELVIFRVSDQLIVQMVLRFQAPLAKGIKIKIVLYL